MVYPSGDRVPKNIQNLSTKSSTFKFTYTKSTIIPATNKNVTNFYYKLPDGWKTVQDETEVLRSVITLTLQPQVSRTARAQSAFLLKGILAGPLCLFI